MFPLTTSLRARFFRQMFTVCRRDEACCSCTIVVEMATRVTSWLSRPSLLRTFVTNVRVTARLLREPAVPLIFKMIPLLAAGYVISPLDFIPDALPIIGQLDDLGIVFIAIEAFLRVCPRVAVDFHRAAVAEGRRFSRMPATGDVIDAEFRRERER